MSELFFYFAVIGAGTTTGAAAVGFTAYVLYERMKNRKEKNKRIG